MLRRQRRAVYPTMKATDHENGEAVKEVLSKKPRAEREGVNAVRFPNPMQPHEHQYISRTGFTLDKTTTEYVLFTFDSETDERGTQ